MKSYRHGKTTQARGAYGRFRRWSLADFNTGTAVCPECGALNPYTLVSFEDAGGFTQTKHNAPPTICNQCGASLTGHDDFDPRDPADDNDPWTRRTPDPAGEDVTVPAIREALVSFLSKRGARVHFDTTEGAATIEHGTTRFLIWVAGGITLFDNEGRYQGETPTNLQRPACTEEEALETLTHFSGAYQEVGREMMDDNQIIHLDECTRDWHCH